MKTFSSSNETTEIGLFEVPLPRKVKLDFWLLLRRAVKKEKRGIEFPILNIKCFAIKYL